MEIMAQQRRRQRRSSITKEATHSNRRIYDPRRWHRSLVSSSFNSSGQPPAGWVLVWAGRFKRWRRRWFVAHPPGLLLHYKNSDQIGRPGCISLLEATVVPAIGKERQFKIMKGSMVYHLRATNRDYRQAWLDAIQESMRVYTKSVQKAAVGAGPGHSLLPQQSIPSHAREEWEEQEKELNRRLEERLQDLEAPRQAFLQQLQILQHSLTVISGALGFTDHSLVSKKATPSPPQRRVRPHREVFDPVASHHLMTTVSCEKNLSSSEILPASPPQNLSGVNLPVQLVQENGSRQRNRSKSLFKWKGDHESRQGKRAIRSQKSVPVQLLSGGKNVLRNRCRSLSFPMEGSLGNREYMLLQDGSCIGAEDVTVRKRGAHGLGLLQNGHLSEPELGAEDQAVTLWKSMGSDPNFVITPTSSEELKTNIRGELEVDLSMSCKENDSGLTDQGASRLGGVGNHSITGVEPGLAAVNFSLTNEDSQGVLSSHPTPGNSELFVEGPLHAAWNCMQNTFAEALKEEIHRILELEAENAVLQESLALLPQLQQDRVALLNLRERLKNECACGRDNTALNREIDGEDGDGEGDDTEDEISIVHTELTNEEYFEALEVLNQHDFMARVTSPDEHGSLVDRAGWTQEPPEEGDYTVETDMLSEAEGEELDQPSTRCIPHFTTHHDCMARVTSPEEHESLVNRAGWTQEPPEEGDYTVETDMLSEAEGEELDQPRTRLPAPRPLSRGFSVWTVLKNAVGRDLNHITMPATINEPLSVLQKCAEELQYRIKEGIRMCASLSLCSVKRASVTCWPTNSLPSCSLRDLLELAVQEEDSLERLLMATTFTCASYYGSIHRDAKPFNPLLGETFEFHDGRSWFLAEQVSHHPPILAFQSENNSGSYMCYGEIELVNKFWGRSIEVLCNGAAHLKIPKFKDHFTWNRVTLCIHNVVVGKVWIDNYGELAMRNHTTGEVSRVRFHKASSREQCRISGKIYDSRGFPQYAIFGNYMDRIFVCPEPCTNFDIDNPKVRCLWKSPEPIEDYHQQYCFTRYTLGLNELTPKLAEALPPTDSRFRPDQRALEEGDLEKATPEKLRLEEKQRLARRSRKQEGGEWQCSWFEQREPGVMQVKSIEDGDVEPSWIYGGKYWEAREKQAWEKCPDIM